MTRPTICGAVAVGLGLVAAACGGGSSGGMTATDETVTLLDVHAQVFSQRCALSGCHVTPGAPFDLDLGSVSSAAQNLIGVASAELPALMRVEPGNPTDSYLYMKVTADPRISGDPMPQLGPPLNAADISLIETWILQGAE